MRRGPARQLVCVSIATVPLLLCPAAASAHPMQGVGDFYAGMLHPLTAIEFLLPMIALSLLAGQQGRRSAIAMLAAFPLSLAVGAALGIPIHPPSIIGRIDLSSMAGLGLLVAAARPLPPSVAAALSVMLGLAIGLPTALNSAAKCRLIALFPASRSQD